MFCSKCGSNIPDGSSVCPNCGTNVGMSNFTQNVNNAFQNAEQQVNHAMNDVHQTFQNGGAAPNSGERLDTQRSLIAYIVLSLITCGIYSYYFIYKMAHDVNVACEGDGESTGGLVAFIVLSMITCGIYAWIWYYKLGNRLASNAPRYNLHFQENGTTVLCWLIFGSFLCGIGSFVAMHILIKNTNIICNAYNQSHGMF